MILSTIIYTMLNSHYPNAYKIIVYICNIMANDLIFFSISSGLQTREQICAKIAKIDILIDFLYTTAIESVTNANIIKYKLDSGQSVQEVEYTTAKQVTDAIQEYEKLRQLLQNKLTSRSIRLMDGKNFY